MKLFERKKKDLTNRYHLIDSIRGFAVINMVLFHLMFDIFMVYNVNPNWYWHPLNHIWQQGICWTFIFISGFVWDFSGTTGNLKRGLLLNICGLIISLVTFIVEPSEVVWFGIMNFYGCAVWLMIPAAKLFRKVNPYIGICVSFILFLLFLNMQEGYLSLFHLFKLSLPKVLYDINVLMPFGFPGPKFYSSDYFPIFPWFFWFTAGFFGQKIFDRFEAPKRIAKFKIPVLDVIGRKALIIYMLHQVVCYGVCFLLFEVFKIG